MPGEDPTSGAPPMSASTMTELEIGAFMGPHIKRARIALVIVGALNVVWGCWHYGDVAELRRMVVGYRESAGADPAYLHARHVVMLVYAMVVGAIVAGVANVVLAAVAGKKTMLAFYAAAGIFVVDTALDLYASPANLFVLSDPLWWVTTIALGMGFVAALKAEHLRANAAIASR